MLVATDTAASTHPVACCTRSHASARRDWHFAPARGFYRCCCCRRVTCAVQPSWSFSHHFDDPLRREGLVISQRSQLEGALSYEASAQPPQRLLLADDDAISDSRHRGLAAVLAHQGASPEQQRAGDIEDLRVQLCERAGELQVVSTLLFFYAPEARFCADHAVAVDAGACGLELQLAGPVGEAEGCKVHPQPLAFQLC
jgi:hypothetical protein